MQVNIMCGLCERYHVGRFACDAFPQELPAKIVEGFDHREAFPGDNGIRFKNEDKRIIERIKEIYD